MRSFAGIRGKDKPTRRVPARLARWFALGLLAVPGAGSAQVAPDAEWRTLHTDHFKVTFPAGLETEGRQAASRAEARLSRASVFLPRASKATPR